ncbi:MAG: OmpA family protein [Thioalkalivibrionaceae bacterium]
MKDVATGSIVRRNRMSLGDLSRDAGPFELGETDGEGWVSIADLMAVLMLTFLLVSVVFMLQLSRDSAADRAVATAVEQRADQRVELRAAIYAALLEEFRDDLPRWNAELDASRLTLRFRDPELLFASASARLRPEFEAILNDFLPRYAMRLQRFEPAITEIRIEGHTSSEWAGADDAITAYLNNLDLSQARAAAVVRHAAAHRAVRDAGWFRARLVGVGYSSSRPMLDKQGQESPSLSRRVEFAVTTAFDRDPFDGRADRRVVIDSSR